MKLLFLFQNYAHIYFWFDLQFTSIRIYWALFYLVDWKEQW